jgi:serine phosphatase RsbU (regulator of sigma subunit)
MRVHSNLRIDEILQATLDGFVTALRADLGDIKLLDGDTWVVRYEVGFGPGVVGTRLSIPDAPVAARVAALREPVTVQDYLAEPETFYVGFPLAHHLRSCVAVPLIAREEVVGCLFAWMKDAPRVFTEGEVDFARRVAASVALALENARLFEAEHNARKRAEEIERRLEAELETTRLLLRAAEELTTASGTDDIIERLAGLIREATDVPRVFINLIDMQTLLLTPKLATGGLRAPRGNPIPFSRLSETSRRAIFAKQTVLLDYELPETPEGDRAIAEANSARLVLFVPLLHQNEVIGHIAMDQPGRRYEFAAEQIRIVNTIAAQAAVALQNARLFEREHRIAETLQHAILAPPRDIEALEFAHWYQPASTSANVGGDFYDVFELPDGRVALVVGDVAGKGIEAAQLTTLIRDGIRAYLLEESEPSAAFERVNMLVNRFAPTEKFATAFLGVLDCATGILRYSGAGHPPAIVLGDGGAWMLEAGQGLLGALETMEFETFEAVIPAGEIICLYTDGVTEARCGDELFGEQGALEALRRLHGTPVSNLPHAFLSEVTSACDPDLRDDIVILCAARRATAAS